MHKKSVAFVIAALMIWALAAPAFAAGNPFADVPRDHWAYDAVTELAQAGLIEGYPDGTFGGDRNFTRYEMAMVFARILARSEEYLKSLMDQGLAGVNSDINDLNAAIEEAKASLKPQVEKIVKETVVKEVQPEVEKQVEKAVETQAGQRTQAQTQPQAGQVQQTTKEVVVERPFEMTPEAETAIRDLISKGLADELKSMDVSEDDVAEAMADGSVSVSDIVDKLLAKRLAELTEIRNLAVNAGAKADLAQESADDANNAALDAKDVAGAAQTTADNAKTAAGNAQTQANMAKVSATKAQSSADAADGKAAAAQETADAADGKAAAAQETADAADGKAAAAQETADAAQQTAESAQAMAEEAARAAAAADSKAEAAQTTADAAAEAVQATDAKADAAQNSADAANRTAVNAGAKADLAQESADDANNAALDAKDMAKAAQDTADAGRVAAGKAQTTANMARVAAGKAQTTANMARTDAAHLADALDAVRGNVETLSKMVDAKVAGLSRDMEAMAGEFNSELETLGVRVSSLEALFNSVDSRLGALEETVGEHLAGHEKVKLSGSTEVVFNQVAVEGATNANNNDTAWKDPRNHDYDGDDDTGPADNDDDDYYAPKDEFKNVLTLNLEATPAENVTVKAEVGATTDLFGIGSTSVADSAWTLDTLNLDLTTPGFIRSARFGDLDPAKVAAGFNKFTLVEDEFRYLEKGSDTYASSDDYEYNEDPEGLAVNFVQGGLTGTTFVSRWNGDTSSYGFGTSVDYKLSDLMHIGANFVRHTPVANVGAAAPTATDPTGKQTDAEDVVASFNAAGQVGNIDYGMTMASNSDAAGKAGAFDGTLSTTLGIVKLDSAYGYVQNGWDPYYAKVLDSDDGDLTPDQKQWKLKGEAPVFGLTLWAEQGRKDTVVTTGKYYNWTTLGAKDIDVLGIGTASVTNEARVHENGGDDVTTDTVFDTNIADADIKLQVHRRQGTWAANPANADGVAGHTLINIDRDLNLILPLNAGVEIGMSSTATPDTHQKVDLSLEDYTFAALPAVTWNATAEQITNKYVDAGNWGGDDPDWTLNEDWNTRDERSLDTKASLAVNDQITANGGYEVVNVADDPVPAENGVTTTTTAGVDYRLVLWDADVTLGYEYKTKSKDGVSQGATNAYKGSFSKPIKGGATLIGEGVIYMGKIQGEDGNDKDTIASLNLDYPVYESVSLGVDGRVVRSKGASANEYTATELSANLKVSF